MEIIDILAGGISFRKITRHFEFDAKERKDFHSTTLLISAIFFFFIWAFTDLNFTTGILTAIFCLVVTSITLFLFIAIPKIVAIMRRCKAKYRGWTIGLLFSFVISFLSYGLIPVIFPGIIEVESILRLRHGEVFHYERKKDVFWTLISAPITNIILVLLLKPIYNMFPNPFIYYIMVLNALMAVVAMLPLPENIGSHIFYVKKRWYFSLLFFFILFLILVLIKSPYMFWIALMGLILGWLLTKTEKLSVVMNDSQNKYEKK
ncbi:MAG: hypothetical protein AB7V77_05365 [Candidatus Woesearchaeota archaeon]